MSLFGIGDLHLSFGTNKPMDIFHGWDNYVEKLKMNWISQITDEDTVVLIGDTSWAMNFTQAKADFDFINKLPGKKIILKGNHDYWWTTKNKMDNFFADNGFSTLNILHNNHYKYENYCICGTRGWINETEIPADKKVLLREASRLEASIQSAVNTGLEPIVFLHYPPIFAGDYNIEILDVLNRYRIKQCFYGHIHGRGCEKAINGIREGINFQLLSGDFIQFNPYKIV